MVDTKATKLITSAAEAVKRLNVAATTAKMGMAALTKTVEGGFQTAVKKVFGLIGEGLTPALNELAGSALGRMKQALAGVGEAAAGAVAPLANAFAPVLEWISAAIAGALNALASLNTWLFGTAAGYSKAAGAAKGYAKSTSAAAKATGALAAFDKLDVLNTGGGSGSGGAGITAGDAQEAGDAAEGLIQRLLAAAKLAAGELLRTLSGLFGPSIAAWSESFAALRDAAVSAFSRIGAAALEFWQQGLLPLGQYLVLDFIPTIVNALSGTLAPILADIGSFVLNELAASFTFWAGIATNAVHSIVIPAFELLKNIAVGILEGIASAWNEYGAAILEHLAKGMDGVRQLMATLYYDILLPIIEKIIEVATWLWDEHLKPLWDNLCRAVLALGETLAAFWANVCMPLVNWVASTFGPVLAGVWGSVAETLGRAVAVMADFISGLLRALRGILEFLTGIFTGDWQKAWQGLGDFAGGVMQALGSVIKGVVNLIISLVNGMISGVCGGINAVVRSLNTISFTVPDWVPVFGGSHFGLNLNEVTPPQIPYLAQGAVIPPGKEFLAVLGDQKSGNNLEAPEGLIRQLLREELSGMAGGDINIKFTGSLSQLARVLKPEIERETARQGVSLVL